MDILCRKSFSDCDGAIPALAYVDDLIPLPNIRDNFKP